MLPYDRRETSSRSIRAKKILRMILKMIGEYLFWTAPGYASFEAILVAGNVLHASLIVFFKQLDKKVTLPPNLEELFKASPLLYHQYEYMVQHKKSATILEIMMNIAYQNSSTMQKDFESWKDTLVTIL